MPCPRTHEQWGEWRWWFLYNSPPAMEEWEGDKFSTRNGPQTPEETIQKKSGDDFPEEWGDITIWSTQTHRWVGTSLGSETIRCVTLYDFSLGYWVVGQVIWPGYHLYSFSSTFLYIIISWLIVLNIVWNCVYPEKFEFVDILVLWKHETRNSNVT